MILGAAVIGAVVDRLLHLHGAAALALVFLLPALESSAFIGFLFPGEIAVLLGGVLASYGRFPLVMAIVAAVAGAFVGDSVGYAIGRRYGRGILRGTFGRLPFIRTRLDAELAKAEAFLIRRGAAAVIIGRLTAALRVLVPGLAGMARMPYGKFAAANVTGAVLWGTGFSVAGYVAGNSWEKVQSTAGAVGLMFGAALIVGFVATRLILSARRRRVEAALPAEGVAMEAALIDATGVVPAGGPLALERVPETVGAGGAAAAAAGARRNGDVRHEPDRPGWFRRRLALREPLGLPLTISVAAMVAAGWGFVGLLVNVLNEDVTRFDLQIQDFTVHHRFHLWTGVMKAANWLGGVWVISGLLVLAAAYLLFRRRNWKGAVILAAAFLGALGLAEVVAAAVDRVRPPVALREIAVTGSAFPSGQATVAAAFYAMLAIVLTVGMKARWRVAVWTAAVFVIAAAGLPGVYLGVHWLSDVLAGYALGGMWVTLLAAVFLVSRRRVRGSMARAREPAATVRRA
ncbi:MAG TPA: bifunctional DedA family/phosphatase PAP2 family protein [Actinomycetota bacterium]